MSDHNQPKQHVFLSYSRLDRERIRTIHKDLVDAKETVWWDDDLLPGQDWKLEIRKAIKRSYACIIFLSSTDDRPEKGIHPEIRQAIAKQRLQSPGDVFLVPVRLDSCEIPPFEIDDVTMLDSLQHVDLFPSQNYAMGLQKLLAALRAADLHPSKRASPATPEPPASAITNAAQTQPDQPSTDQYLSDLTKETSHIAIRGLQVGTGQAHRFPIDQLYVSLTTTAAPNELQASEQPDDQPDNEQPTSDQPSLEDEHRMRSHAGHAPLHKTLNHRKLVIVGDPGAGKTTFLHRLTFALCKMQNQDSVPEDPFCQAIGEAKFPILLRVASFIRFIQQHHGTAASSNNGAPTDIDSPAWLAYYLHQLGTRDHHWKLDQEFFEAKLQAGGCLVMLDGLDEAPDRISRQAISKLIEKATDRYDQCAFVISSRPPAYTGGTVLPDFHHSRIDPFSDESMHTFLAAWCAGLYGDDHKAAAEHLKELTRALDERPDIRDMVRNPVMLTALAVMHWNERRLPHQRADLYQSIIRWLSQSRDQKEGRENAERAVALLGQVALAMQNHPDGRQVQVLQTFAADAIESSFKNEQDPTAAAKKFLADEELDSGIVVGRGADVRFWHLTFQEYLAASTIAGMREKKQIELLIGAKKLYDPAWREVVLLLAGILYPPEGDRVDQLIELILDELYEGPDLSDEEPDLADQAKCVGLLGAILRDLSPYNYQPADERFDRVMKSVLAIFDVDGSAQVPLSTRLSIGEILGRNGDPRRGVGLCTEHAGVPDILWCDIPGGNLMMGAKKGESDASDNEIGPNGKPLPVVIEPFRIAAYPVTHAQFRPFVDGDGYTNQDFWTDAGWEWKESNKRTKPYLWGDSKWSVGNHPVVGVSWHEAVAWCNWMTVRMRETGQIPDQASIRLPSEAEWEWVARGPGALKYPWGDNWQEEACNCEQTNHGRTSAVGLFPKGSVHWWSNASNQPCCELAGNVWEWCATKWRASYAEPPDDDIEGKVNEFRCQRGGAYFSDATDVRCSRRYYVFAGSWLVDFGFRCAQ